MLLDVSLFVLVAVLGGIGIARGLVRQVWGLLVVVLLLVLRPWHLAPLAGMLAGLGPEGAGGDALRALLGFVGLYVLGLLLGRLVVEGLVRHLPVVNEMDRILGLALGLLKGALLATLLAWVIEAGALTARAVDGELPRVEESRALQWVGGKNPWLLRAIDRSQEADNPRRERLAALGVLNVLQGVEPGFKEFLLNRPLAQVLGRAEVRLALLGRVPKRVPTAKEEEAGEGG